MEWMRAAKAAIENGRDYRVQATKVAGEWVYCAFAPKEDYGTFKARLKSQYEQGEQVPTQSGLLGCWRGDGALDRAKGACDEHWGRNREERKSA